MPYKENDNKFSFLNADVRQISLMTIMNVSAVGHKKQLRSKPKAKLYIKTNLQRMKINKQTQAVFTLRDL